MVKYAEHVSIKRIGPVAWPGALAFIVLMGLAPGIARAEDDQSSSWSLDKKIYEMFRGVGQTPKPTLEAQSENQERPPLVVPPSPGLPPPQASAPARDPNRPVAAPASRQAAEKRKTPQAIDLGAFTNPLPPSELRSAAAGSAATNVPNPPASDVEMTDNLRPSQLGSSGGFFSMLFGSNNGRQQEQQPQQAQQPQPPPPLQQPQPQQPQQVGALAGEPPRTKLIDPPAGYQAASPSQSYGTARPANYGRPRPPDPLSE